MSTVLVTGTGAIIGYGIIRSLKMEQPGIRVVATDVYEDAAGQNWADEFVQAPFTNNSKYKDWLLQVVNDYQIDMIIPGIEQDVSFLAACLLKGDTFPTKLALNRPELINLSADKLEFDQLLVTMNSDCRIVTAYSGSFEALAEKLGLPFLMKPRQGYASKGIIKVYTPEDFAPLVNKLGLSYIAQEYVGVDEEEYTVGVFCDSQGDIRSGIALNRKLANDGSTLKAKLVDIEPFESVLKELCSTLIPEGPTNFQFRLTEDGPKLLEINPRISSSTSIRAAFGMNEASMCVDYYLINKEINQAKLKPGRAIRYIEDLVIYS